MPFAASTPISARNADSFRLDLHPDLKADFILANPPFNMSDWGAENLRRRALQVRHARMYTSNSNLIMEREKLVAEVSESVIKGFFADKLYETLGLTRHSNTSRTARPFGREQDSSLNTSATS